MDDKADDEEQNGDILLKDSPTFPFLSQNYPLLPIFICSAPKLSYFFAQNNPFLHSQVTSSWRHCANACGALSKTLTRPPPPSSSTTSPASSSPSPSWPMWWRRCPVGRSPVETRSVEKNLIFAFRGLIKLNVCGDNELRTKLNQLHSCLA